MITFLRYLCYGAVLSYLSQATATNPTLPSMPAPATYNALADPQADYIGKRLMLSLRQQDALLQDPISQSYIQQLGQHLSQHTPQHPPTLHATLAKNDSINAFAAPGNHIVLFTGLITAAQTPSELASVMAHEIAHLSQRHLERILAAQPSRMVPVAIGIISAIAASVAGRPDLVHGAILSGQSVGIHQQLHQNRSFEFEADRIAMQTMQHAQLDPKGLPDFLSRMQQQNMSYGTQSAYVSTHPLLQDRIADASNRSYQTTQVNPNSLWVFRLIQTRVTILTHPQPVMLKNAYQHQLADGNDNNQALATYALALIDLNNHQAKAAAIKLKSLIQAHPKESLFYYDLAQCQTQQQQYQHAIESLAQAKSLTTENAPMTLAMASNHQALQQWSQASQQLQQAIKLMPEQPELYMQLATIQAEQQQYTEAYLSRAKGFAIDLDLASAITQIKTAQQQNNLSASNKRILREALAHYQRLQQRYHGFT